MQACEKTIACYAFIRKTEASVLTRSGAGSTSLAVGLITIFSVGYSGLLLIVIVVKILKYLHSKYEHDTKKTNSILSTPAFSNCLYLFYKSFRSTTPPFLCLDPDWFILRGIKFHRIFARHLP